MSQGGVGYTVQFTPAALEDLEESWDYVAQENPSAGDCSPRLQAWGAVTPFATFVAVRVRERMGEVVSDA